LRRNLLKLGFDLADDFQGAGSEARAHGWRYRGEMERVAIAEESSQGVVKLGR
jgi:hypothetical protein